MQKNSYESKLKKELGNLPEGWIVLVETNVETISDAGLALTKLLIDKSYSGIIISASRPCNNLLELYKNKKINADKIFVIDCVCQGQGIKKSTSGVLHLDSVSSLTDISIALDNALQKKTGKTFVFVDSILSMLIHNDPHTFAKFIHGILTKIRINKANGLLISVENETNKEVRAEIAQLCDKVIHV